jgi:PAS domain-containing protein
VRSADPDAAGREGLAEELERQKQYFESLLEISPVAIVTTDLDTTVTSWNPEAERLFGYTREEAIGRPVDDLIACRRASRRAWPRSGCTTSRPSTSPSSPV